jgi:hypothetical protein
VNRQNSKQTRTPVAGGRVIDANTKAEQILAAANADTDAQTETAIGDLRLGLLSLETDERVSAEPESALGRLHSAEALAGVVLHTLVAEHLSAFQDIVKSVQRDIRNPQDRAEVNLALRLLELYELAARNDTGWVATLPAHMAAALSF